MSEMARDDDGGAREAEVAVDAGGAELPLAEVMASPRIGEALVGECVDDRHPTIDGRVLVRWATSSEAERWLPVLQGLSVRTGDRVLLQRPSNWPEPLVIGVIDGYRRRATPRRISALDIRLSNDEELRVTAADGAPLVSVHASDGGPVVKLEQPDVLVEMAGALRVDARSIELRAREGAVDVSASGDVIIQGETVQLN